MKNLRELGFSQYCATVGGRIYSLRSEKFLSLQNKGYLMVNLVHDDGRKVNTYVHRLVARVHCTGYSEGLHVNHKDGIKSNNNARNLEWVTRSEDMIHAYREGLVKSKSILSEETVHKVCRLLEQGARPVDVAEAVGATPFNVQDILEKESFAYISEEYDFSNVKRKMRLSEGNIVKVCELFQEGKDISQVEKLTGLKRITVRRIFKRETFQYLTNNYKW